MSFSIYAPSLVVLKGGNPRCYFAIEASFAPFFFKCLSSTNRLSSCCCSEAQVVETRTEAKKKLGEKNTSTFDEHKPKRLRKAKDTKKSSSTLNIFKRPLTGFFISSCNVYHYKSSIYIEVRILV
ncbi:unnamed protein product [Arabidopsis lyrata]|uniref:uncharacterized protein LOC9321902 isoform X2 n=1 Tax=Arabidopsis lyrata subsp. lyrata TaxID=81972 RepID=UPI000A29D2B3|nr:uncharacterized protein LOC9321902 isoform X2 [Arabidopsis lyrata subsp. lyrata]CAH8262092.1 unnamed protein product [Arabidopsis lyrata]|eukprot:XP_020886053.1 uncharacterized protein LOC9321902 isoform X2 [Arabidopsis lyrata subsp. lyrata]